MRLLHTADWHLGQTLHGFDRSVEHQAFLDWLLDVLTNEDIDVLLLAGDIFDTANPPSAAQHQFYRFVAAAQARQPGLAIVAIAGNHDSAGRLEAPLPLLELCRVNVVGQTRRLPDGAVDLERLLVPLHDRSGALRAWCLAVPFLRPGDVPRVTDAPAAAPAAADVSAAEDRATHEPAAGHARDPYLDGVVRLYRDTLTLACARRAPDQAIIALGHCHLSRGQISEASERPLVIGGAEALDAALFDDRLAYVALGHLHRPQVLGTHPVIRYSGSPLPMSFSEREYPHQVVVVELDGAALAASDPVRSIRVPRRVDLLRIPPQPRPLDEVLAALAAWSGGDPALPDTEWPYLSVAVLLDGPEPTLRQQVEHVLAGKAVRLARIDVQPRVRAGDNAPTDALSLDALAQLDPRAVYTAAYRNRFAAEPPPETLAALTQLMNASDDASAGDRR
ncbi:exonuclease SbcCD subunit D [Chitinasiproducens palmae]|uniref:Nuclease SbcCD subunit D n=1 Tax=Chitinasiproducens palmae TaxID=1770053 RepID=A0A1H2PSU3_9BURK|nr:exonuclease SbcCD subunit D C-terminal domain-containing protein [Chitinasiproducens palmae]SDV50084.1 Exodeoxyribonuclease I subunit D [Chitinasiproducens palmae]